MKLLLPAVLLFFIATTSNAQIEASLGAGAMIPTGRFSNPLNTAWGPSFNIGIKPFKKQNFWVSFDMMPTYLDQIEKRITLVSPGTPETVTTDMNYLTTFNNFSLTGRYEFPLSKKWTTYATLSAVYLPVTTRIKIVDPASEDECVYLEDRKLMRSHPFGIGLGSGIKFKLGKDYDEGINAYWLDFSVSYLRAPRTEIANLNQIQTLQPGEVYKIDETNGTPVGITFRNIHTNTTHEHFVMQVQNLPLRMLQLKLTFVMEGMPWSSRKY